MRTPEPAGCETQDRLLRVRQIIGDKEAGIDPILPISRTSFWRLVRAGKVTPIHITPRTVAFRASEIKALVATPA